MIDSKGNYDGTSEENSEGKNSSKSGEKFKKTNISEATEKDWEDFWYHEEASKGK
ncbi:hypothetical protein Syn7803C97_25 [Synechococcus phage S-MbCM6]|uniref:Uncharacterized protein n=2 Tax=Namakavirus smbcm6 TaxID=2734120 RepID=H8ZMD0_9CAUD|nr:hypothetical protein [Synechococcus phage ACG-2014c]AFD02641.1 hypothetical protein [Synechococcus phage ACG-2014c]AIX22578.1 hypothetical protein Syn7803C97_25 [Synechococcus phage ACG-2014c]AIX22792.1 hypothetical protein Syn7803C98_24 [Synechococcus phage ACG-2014c]